MFYAGIAFWSVLGLFMGSFFLVVATRLSEERSIVKPRSHCDNCKKTLTFKDLMPLISYLFSRGKCRYCQSEIGGLYPLIEICTGLLFAINYILFFNEPMAFIIGLVIASLIIIICVSDFKYLIIPDQVLIAAVVIIVFTRIYFEGIIGMFPYLAAGVIAFIAMLLIKLAGDFIFKKESMGGADIKLMFVSGLILGLFPSIMVIFLASILALPVAIMLYYKSNNNVLAFGPFITLAIYLLFIFAEQFDALTRYFFIWY